MDTQQNLFPWINVKENRKKVYRISKIVDEDHPDDNEESFSDFDREHESSCLLGDRVLDRGETVREIAEQIKASEACVITRWKKGDRGDELRRPKGILSQRGFKNLQKRNLLYIEDPSDQEESSLAEENKKILTEQNLLMELLADIETRLSIIEVRLRTPLLPPERKL